MRARDNLVVVAGIEVKLVAAQLHGLRDLRDVAAGFLHRHNVRVFGKLPVGGGGDIDAGAGGDVVQDDRQVGGRPRWCRNGGSGRPERFCCSRG